ncbi:MAG: hypothetical protein BZY88_02905 [SAR202 cluster bacterium Io17-Chloro-G9]|nr:MAG: hypothetical protein BZY88_02905 [SAR202 cluster bacterium Io17-Chloro-G9]
MAKAPNTWLIALRLTGLGWYVATCLVLGILGGVGLDKLLGTTPLFILLGTLLGSVVAFWGLYKMVQPILNASKGPDPENRDVEDQGRDD